MKRTWHERRGTEQRNSVRVLAALALVPSIILVLARRTAAFRGSRVAVTRPSRLVRRKPSPSLAVCRSERQLSVLYSSNVENGPTESSVPAHVQALLSQVTLSLDKQEFISLTLFGPKRPSKKKGSVDTERLRGCIRQVQGRLIALKSKKTKSETLLQMTIKYHGATDVAKNWPLGQVQCGLEALLLATTEAPASEWGTETLHPCGTPLGIQRAELTTIHGKWKWSVTEDTSQFSFHKSHVALESNEAILQSHDRTRQTPLANKAPFWQALGIARHDGTPRRKMSSKRKQCQKFVEIVSALVVSCLEGREFKEVDTISTVDMGCGRGYLTFALHAYLYENYRSEYAIETRGIDVRPKLVREINGIAESLGSDFSGLQFDQGTIEDALVSIPNNDSDNAIRVGVSIEPERIPSRNALEVLMALHACDTASDDALWCGIRNQCDIIVVAPCCHKQIRKQLDVYVARHMKQLHPYAAVLRHNIYRERFAETATDSIRALLLEIANYNVQVFEFIGGEHTSKNVMITAVKRRRPRGGTELEEMRRRLQSLLEIHGVHEQRLAQWMGELHSVEIRLKPSKRTMPPIT